MLAGIALAADVRSAPAPAPVASSGAGADRGRDRRRLRLNAARAAIPRIAQALARARFPRALGPARSSPGVSSTQGRPSKRGAERNAAQPVLAELALADVGVAVAVGAERRLRVVEVQRADPLGAELRVEPRRARRPCRRRCGCHSRRRAGGRSPGRRRGARRRRRPRSARRAPRTSARACRRRRRCSRGAAGSPRSRPAPPRSSRRRARSPRRRRRSCAEPGCSTTPAAPIASPDAQRVGQRVERSWRGCRGPRWRS